MKTNIEEAISFWPLAASYSSILIKPRGSRGFINLMEWIRQITWAGKTLIG
jgi:hypothetical protein